MEAITLFAKDATGKLRYWSIAEEDCVIEIEYGVVGGEPIIETEEVFEGKAGRTVEEQIMLRINSRVKKKKDAGYVNDIDVARSSKRTNSLGFAKPMLAAKFEQCSELVKDGEFAMQRKYDGFRCIVTKQGGQMFAYTRGGQLLTTIGHILDELKHIPEGTSLDGELYHHGWTLQKIAGSVKRDYANEDSKQIQYMVYDTIESDMVYSERYELISTYLELTEMAVLVPTWFELEANTIPKALRREREKGYEGLMLRLDVSKVGRKIQEVGYEDGKRSKSLLKVKAWEDEEFLIVDKDYSEKGRPRFWCVTNDGKKFKVTPPGTVGEKESLMVDCVGRHVKVEFANYTKDGIPFQPVATMMREKNQE